MSAGSEGKGWRPVDKMTFRDYHPKSAAKLKMRTREEEGEMMKLGLNWQIRVAPNAKILTLLLLLLLLL